MKKFGLLFAVVSILLSASFVLCACGPATPTSSTGTTSVPASAEKFELKFAYHTPPKASMVTAYFNPWTTSIESASNGKIKITHYAGESLVRGRDQYDAVESGLCDIALVDPSETPGRFPQSEFDTLPFLFPDTYVGAKVYWDMVQKYMVNTDFKNVAVLGVLLIPPCNYIGNKPVKDPADFKGNRVRFSARTEGWTIEALGGTPVEVQTADLYTSMERGVIDSTFLAWSFIATVGLAEVSKYSTDCSLYCRAWPIVMNKKTWNSLGTDLQKIVMAQSGQEISAKYTAENEAISQGTKKGVVNSFKMLSKDPIYELTPDQMNAWKAAVLPVWDKWANELETTKKLPGKAIIADVKAAVAKYSVK